MNPIQTKSPSLTIDGHRVEYDTDATIWDIAERLKSELPDGYTIGIDLAKPTTPARTPPEMKGKNRAVVVTRDGKSNKEPDWAPVREKQP